MQLDTMFVFVRTCLSFHSLTRYFQDFAVHTQILILVFILMISG